MSFDFWSWWEKLQNSGAQQTVYPAIPYFAELREILDTESFYPQQETQLLELSCCGVGYVRELAVRKLSQAHSAAALGTIIERLNDWVPQVRNAAVTAAEGFLRNNDVAIVLPCLDAILALSRKQRGDHAVFINRIDKLLHQPETHDSVKAFFNTCQGASARYLFAQMLSWQDVDLCGTVNIGARHRDMTVRMAALNACGQLHWATALPLLHSFQADKQPVIRKEALRISWTKADNPNARRMLLQQFLLDSSTSVRELALWCARQTDFDVDEFLRQAMESFPRYDATNQGSLGLIGMLRAQQYLPLVQSSFMSRSPAIRRAALVAWAQISKETVGEVVVQAILATGKLSKLAKRLMTKGLFELSGEQHTYIVETALSQRQFDKALGFISRLPIWDRFEYLLRCLAGVNDAEELAKLKSALREWEIVQNRSYLKLDAAQSLRLRALLGEGNNLAILLAMPRMGFVLKQVGLLEKT